MDTPEAAVCDTWVRRTLAEWFDRAPVDASFVGLHRLDADLPDWSREGAAEMAAWLADRLEDCPVPPDDGPGLVADRAAFAALDATLLRDALVLRRWELESRWLLSNPSVVAGEAVFGLMALLLPQHGADETHRLDALRARLRGLPDFLAGARQQLDRAVPPAWVQRARTECRAARTFLTEGLRHVPFEDPDGVVAALAAFESFEASLSDVGDRDAAPGCGPEALELYMARGHRLDESPEDVLARAREELDRTTAWVSGHAPTLGLSDPHEVADRLRDLHPSASDYYERYGTVLDEVRALSDARGLLTWPDFPLRYVPRPAWSRAAAPGLYFLFYRSPAAMERPDVHDYMVAPLPDDPAEHDAFLRANNESVIRLNHVVHHGGIGHHVQNWHAFRSPLRVGRVGAVDCASRIALFGAGTMAEGWACYATDLVAEAGGLSELEQFAEHVGRIRMCARAIVDVELHTGAMSLDQATAWYVERARMPEAAARAEAVKNSMFPGAAMMYLVGTDRIHRLRRELMRVQGDRFDLRTFHDAFLSWGSIPVSVVADQLLARAGRGLPLGAHDPIPSSPADA